MLRVTVNNVAATLTESETLTSGRVGLRCAFTFSSEWDGLSKIAVFEGAETMDVALLTSNTAVVPAECLATQGAKLRIGVYGMNGAGTIVIPTIWASAGKVQAGAEPAGVSPADPTPSWAAQVQEAAANALRIASSLSLQGLPAGGTSEQVLKKESDADYDAEWADEEGGGGGIGVSVVDNILTFSASPAVSVVDNILVFA